MKSKSTKGICAFWCVWILKLSLIENQTLFHSGHWVTIITFRSCRSHSSHLTLCETLVVSFQIHLVSHTWPFSCPKLIFTFRFLIFLSVIQFWTWRELLPRLALFIVCMLSVTEQMKWKALDCLEAFFFLRSVCSRACRAPSSKPGQNVPWK